MERSRRRGPRASSCFREDDECCDVVAPPPCSVLDCGLALPREDIK